MVILGKPITTHFFIVRSWNDHECAGVHIGDFLHDGRLGTGAQGQHDDDRRHADDDAQHGEKTAHLVGTDGLESYSK